MKLLIDIGNTRLKYAFYNSEQITEQFSLPADGKQLDELENRLSLINLEGVNQVWMASVANPKITELVTQKWLTNKTNLSVHQVKVKKQLQNIKNLYVDIDQLGVDRWVAACGARKLHAQGDVIIVDAGTAITIDWLDCDDHFQGGVILPGARLMHESLVGQTANIQTKLANIFDVLSVDDVVGKNTSECVNAGVSLACVGAIAYVIRKMFDLTNRPTAIVLTGGMASTLHQPLEQVLMKEFAVAGNESSFKLFLQSNLVLHGLLMISTAS